MIKDQCPSSIDAGCRAKTQEGSPLDGQGQGWSGKMDLGKLRLRLLAVPDLRYGVYRVSDGQMPLVGVACS